MWTSNATYLEEFRGCASTSQNYYDTKPIILEIQFDHSLVPIVYPKINDDLIPSLPPNIDFNPEQYQQVEELLSSRLPVTTLNEAQQKLIWTYRHLISTNPDALPKFLVSVPWTDYNARQEAYSLVINWAPISPNLAIYLLGDNFVDPLTRSFAVEVLRGLPSTELVYYLPLLCYCMRFDCFHSNPLLEFLVESALAHRQTLGHLFYWQTQLFTSEGQYIERYGVALEAFLRGCGTARPGLSKDKKVVDQINLLHKKVSVMPAANRDSVISTQLKNIDFSCFKLPFDSNNQHTVKGVMTDKCRFLDGQLLLAFETYKQPVLALVKEGDIRSEVVAIQLLTLMDELWKKKGKDFFIRNEVSVEVAPRFEKSSCKTVLKIMFNAFKIGSGGRS